ncbi:MAG: MATE family efflux transporter, partial [Erysipelotrichaceae bacterium]
MTYIKKYIGDRSFYQTTFYIALPLALQMLLQSCMSIIDTMMVSSIGMVTAVGNASQILMLHDGISWGTISGIAMFASQFFGAKQKDNLGKCFVLSLVIGISNALFWMIMTGFFGGQIMYFYLQDVEVLYYSQLYMQVMVFYLLPYAINNSFMTLYRSTHQTKITLYFSIVGAIANVCLNGFFIFGLNLGVVGAAYGSVIAQVIVLGCNVVYAIKTKQAFIENFAHHFKLDLKFVKPIVYKMLPLIINETLFGFGMTLFVKAFGLLGTDSMSAYYVANQIFQLFLFAVNGYGSAVTILVGTRLGEGRI